MPRIALLFASLHVLMLIVLSYRVVQARRSAQVGIGDGGDRRLHRRMRVHGNFVEYVPIGLLMLALLEAAGLGAMWLWVFGAGLLLGRLMHAYGLSRTAGSSPGRFVGMLLTWAVLLGEAVAGLVLFANGA